MAVPPVRYVGFGLALLGFVLFNYCARERPVLTCEPATDGADDGGGGFKLCLCRVSVRHAPPEGEERCFLCVARRKEKPTERTALISS